MSNSKFFDDLNELDKNHLLTKYPDIIGKFVDTPFGSGYCYGGMCGCNRPRNRQYNRCKHEPGPPCPSEKRWDLTTYMFRYVPDPVTGEYVRKYEWIEGESKFVTVGGGRIISVEY